MGGVEERAVAWVSFDRFDDDPVSVLGLLASAIVQATGADPSLVADMRVHSTAALGRCGTSSGVDPPVGAPTVRADGSTTSTCCARPRATTC